MGMKLQDEEGTTISNLFFADDGILMVNWAEDLDDLKSIVEGYCFDFRMKISAGYLILYMFKLPGILHVLILFDHFQVCNLF